MGHVRSLRLFGPVLVGTIGLAVALCVLCDQLEAINDANRVNMSVLIAAGPILIGAIYDFGGGYQNAFLAVGGSSVLAFLLLLAAGSPDACIRQISGDRAAK